ncbi:type II toxin-antitoxin system HipA family toxin [Azospirillum sp. RWY-5-1]|uniref:Type II toxin-antitoxin system HipA family toxin n=1 Tax=Azospirillum oleiclasticum TaxID=2735135 RepID=A0ABX2T8Y7_9PROT|nr:type II toxin-antitoxin system HipA family toxin [Azospirillum oleiclasticum]NYZ20786.1 type II toxin-antitoxin system HipA family toxin [Azospirillum oleiclasticum]
MNTLPVQYGPLVVGEITLSEDGPTFAYDRRWPNTRGAFPVSLGMPLGAGPFRPEILVPWLANLLPEEANLLAVGRNLGVSPQDVIGVLERIGRDTAGALTIGRPPAGETPGYRPIDGEAELERIIEELPAKPFLAGEDGVSMSLAGAQEKLPVARLPDGRLGVPVNGAPSTHILKPDTRRRLWGSVQNEALCMTLAARCGLKTAPVTTGTAGGRSFLLVSRYDRVQRDGRWLRIHQEDFCQALGRPPGAKYERNRSGVRGPRLVDMFRVVDDHLTAADRMRLLDAVVFNVLIGNTDAHAKNYSILLTGRGALLAPLYDLMCAAVWEHVTRNLSQTIAGKDRGDHIKGRHWQRMAGECGFNRTLILRRIETAADRVRRELPGAVEAVRAMPAGDHPLLAEVATAIEARCRTVVRNLAQVDDGPEDTGSAP